MGKMLRWLDEYSAVQVLFDKDDLRRLRDEVAGMSPGELREWMQQTKEIRRELDSQQWQETREWLREFLARQAMYSDEQIEQFRAKAGQMSSGELHELLERIKRVRAFGQWMDAASQSQRKTSLAWKADYQQKQKEERRAAEKWGYWHKGPYFGSTEPAKVQGYAGAKRYLVPPPLVTSREVARWAVYRAIWPRGW